MKVYKSYQNRLGWRSKLLRGIWGVAYVLLFRFTPSRIYLFGLWRNLLLRLFGARTWHQAHYASSAKVWAPWALKTGRSVAIDEDVDLYNVAPITLGHMVSISRRAFICTASHNISDLSRSLVIKPVDVGNGVWIGAEAYVGPGVTIGEGAVLAARAVVVKDVPPWTVVGGNPARVIKERPVDRRIWQKAFAELEATFSTQCETGDREKGE